MKFKIHVSEKSNVTYFKTCWWSIEPHNRTPEDPVDLLLICDMEFQSEAHWNSFLWQRCMLVSWVSTGKTVLITLHKNLALSVLSYGNFRQIRDILALTKYTLKICRVQ